MPIRIKREFSWAEFCDIANEHKTKNRHWNQAGSFEGYTNFDQAYEMAVHTGYTDHLPDAEKLQEAIQTDMDMGHLNTFEYVFDMAGSEVDMGRFLTGIPECMIEAQPMKVMRTGRVIKLLIPICCSASVGEATFRRRGAAVMALVNVFAQMQHPVDVYAVEAIGAPLKANETYGSSYGRKSHLSYAVRVQRADEPLNQGRMMYALAHPSMLRQLTFAALWQEDELTRGEFGVGSSYGFPGYGTSENDVDINLENAIILPPLDWNESWSEEFSVNWIRTEIARLKAQQS